MTAADRVAKLRVKGRTRCCWIGSIIGIAIAAAASPRKSSEKRATGGRRRNGIRLICHDDGMKSRLCPEDPGVSPSVSVTTRIGLQAANPSQTRCPGARPITDQKLARAPALRQKYPLDQKLEPNPRAKTGRFLPYIRGAGGDNKGKQVRSRVGRIHPIRRAKIRLDPDTEMAWWTLTLRKASARRSAPRARAERRRHLLAPKCNRVGVCVSTDGCPERRSAMAAGCVGLG